MDMDSIYGDRYTELEEIMQFLLGEIEMIREKTLEQSDFDPIEHVACRIKSEESMIEKLNRKGLPLTTEAAFYEVHDAVGIVCYTGDDTFRSHNCGCIYRSIFEVGYFIGNSEYGSSEGVYYKCKPRIKDTAFCYQGKYGNAGNVKRQQ